MNNILKMTFFWLLAVFITLSAAIYQRMTGPTHPKKTHFNVDTKQYQVKLIRSHGGDENCSLEFEINDTLITGFIAYKRYPTNDEWVKLELIRDGSFLKGELPYQLPAGKLEYKIAFYKNEQLLNNTDESHVIIRFKGAVPDIVLIPHVFLMFFAMLISNLAGILAIAKHNKMVLYTNITLILIVVGGMILGPIMQRYAFGELWTGIPFGKDYTDNKTLIALIFWIIAFIANRKKQNRTAIIIATIVMLAIYMVPHSMGGSELNYESGTITTG